MCKQKSFFVYIKGPSSGPIKKLLPKQQIDELESLKSCTFHFTIKAAFILANTTRFIRALTLKELHFIRIQNLNCSGKRGFKVQELSDIYTNQQVEPSREAPDRV